MVAAFNDLAVLQHENRVAVADGGKSVCNDEHRAPAHEAIHALFDERFRAGVYAARRFVQNQHGRVGDRRARNREQLALPLREVCAVGGEYGVVALRQVLDERMRVGELRRFHDFLVRRVQPTVANVVPHGTGEEVCVLQHHGERAAQVVLFDLLDVDAVVGDGALLHIVKAVDQVRNGRFARAGGTDERYLLTGFGKEVDVFQHVHLLVVAEGDVVEAHVALEFNVCKPAFNGAFPGPLVRAAGDFADFALLVALHVDQRYVAFVDLRFRVDELEDALRARQRADKAVKELGSLHNRLAERARVLQKRRQRADIRAPENCQRRTRRGNRRIKRVAEIANDGHEHHGVGHCGGGGLAERFVLLLKHLGDRLFAAEHLDLALAFDHLFNIAVDLGERFLPFAKVEGRFSAELAHHEQHQREEHQHKHGQNGREHQHHDQYTGNADHARNQRGKTLPQHFAQRIRVVGKAAHDFAVGLRVEVAQGKLLQLRKHIHANRLQRCSGNVDDQAVYNVGHQRTDAVDRGEYG